MKYFLKLFVAITCFATIFTACDKVDDLPVYSNGTETVLTGSKATVAPTATDSLTQVVSFSWTNPDYSADSATFKYTLQIDTSSAFTHPVNRIVSGALSTSLTGKELNNILLGYNFAFNVPRDVFVRLISSYANNNEQRFSNTLKINATAYKVPPKIALPATLRLFITGGGTEFGWSNPNPMPAVRELTRIDETTWGGIFNMNGGEYLLLQSAGNWDDKFSVSNASVPAPTAETGTFGFKLPDNFHGNFVAGSGWYKMIYDFQAGKYTASKVANALSPDLYITGSATPGGWSNTPPAPQKFTPVTNGVFEITIALAPGQEYKFLTTSGQWQPQLGGTSATGGQMGSNYGGGNDPANIPTPAVAGNYKIVVNIITNTYTVTKV